MKGMVGICLQPEKAIIETKVRLYNRTYLPKTFLWWENIAVPVNRDYQIFFPTDVHYVYFHYKKSVAEFPIAKNVFSGVDFRGGVDIRWHKNTSMATSFFCSESEFDFFGGYDHGREAGLIHIANHHIVPGKKMFTWGTSQMAKSWENTLTDTDGAYAELMAGAYSDNQPDFSWLEPFETKTFSQYWYPVKNLGEPQNANCKAALCYRLLDNQLSLKLNVTEKFFNANVSVYYEDKIIYQTDCNLLPNDPFMIASELPGNLIENKLFFLVRDNQGSEIISFKPLEQVVGVIPGPTPAVSPPNELKTANELYQAGLHIKQYRDPLIKPEVYWQEALKLEPDHALSNNALGMVLLEKGQFQEAEEHFRRAVKNLTTWNPNPRNGEAYYNLGLTLKYRDKLDEAYRSFYKAAWNYSWQAAAYYALAEIDCIRGNYHEAQEHLKRSLKTNADNLKARNLLAAVQRRLGHPEEALTLIKDNLALDSLDYWALNENFLLGGEGSRLATALFFKMKSSPAQTCLDIAFDYGNAGLYDEACDLISGLIQFDSSSSGQYPMLYYVLGYFCGKSGRKADSQKYILQGGLQKPDCCFPSRLEEMIVLKWVLDSGVQDPKAAYYLGNLLYGKEQYAEALKYWEYSKGIDAGYYGVHRNLAVVYYNNLILTVMAIQSLQLALKLCPGNPQLLLEFDHLLKLSNAVPVERLQLLEANFETVGKRQSLCLERIRLYNLLALPDKAIELFGRHVFIPAEGAEQEVAEQYSLANVMLGRSAIKSGRYHEAMQYFNAAQEYPENLGCGVRHTVFHFPSLYYQGVCLRLLGEDQQAQEIFSTIDYMVIDNFSLMNLPTLPYYKAMALKALGKKDEACKLLREFLTKCQSGKEQKDYGYFKTTTNAVSFTENPAVTRYKYFTYLEGMAYLGLEELVQAKEAFKKVLEVDQSHLLAKIELEMSF